MLCSRCGADISRQRIELQDESVQAYEADEKCRPVYFKICMGCGKLCTADTDLCPSCGAETGYDIIGSYKIPDSFFTGLEKSGISDRKMIIIKDGVPLKTIALSEGLCAFGRSTVSEFSDRIKEIKYISELHCLILNESDSLQLIDLSLNGTFINGRRALEVCGISGTVCADIIDDRYLSLRFE